MLINYYSITIIFMQHREMQLLSDFVSEMIGERLLCAFICYHSQTHLSQIHI